MFMTFLITVVNNRFMQNQIYTTIDSTYQVNHVPFPAVAICNENLVDKSEIKNIQYILTSYGLNETKIDAFLYSLPKLLHYDDVYDDADHFQDILSILRNHYFNLDTIMEEVHQGCSNLLVYCAFNRKVKNCNNIFSLIKTSHGHCCAFNYAALNDESEDPIDGEVAAGEEFYKEYSGVIVTSEVGRLSGLTVLFDVEPADYLHWGAATFHGAKILVFDPFDYPEVLYVKHAAIGESLDLKVEPVVDVSVADLERINVEDRGCWFDHESKLIHSNKYTYDTCQIECKMRNYIKFCGCLPYKYPRETTARICEFSDIACLKKLTGNGNYNLNCSCHFQCDDRSFNVKSIEMPLVRRDHPFHVINAINSSEMISLKVYFVNTFCKCYVKKVFMSFDSLIATFGGILSLTMGGSIPAVFEIIYLTSSYIFTVTLRKILNILHLNFAIFNVK